MAPLRVRNLHGPRPPGRRVLGPVQLLQQTGQRAIEDLSDVAVRNLVTEQILSLAKLVVDLARHAALNLVNSMKSAASESIAPTGISFSMLSL